MGDYRESNDWRLFLKSALENISNTYKVVCINPNDHFNFENETDYVSQREIMEYDLHRVRNADLVIVNFNDPKSLGTMAEIAISYERKIPIIGLNINKEELHPWQIEMCNRIFEDEENLILYITKHYLAD